MHRTEGTNNLANMFVNGPPGTVVEEDWLNTLQEEVAYVIEQAGLVLNTAAVDGAAGGREQLAAAIKILASLSAAAGEAIDIVAAGGIVTISCEDATTANKGVSALATNALALAMASATTVLTPSHLPLFLKPFFLRPKFTYNGGAVAYTILIESGSYNVDGKFAWWDAQLTSPVIAGPAADTWYYLYLDHSAITSGTEITASELIWSTTAPTWSVAKYGWYNGSDRCIFATKTNAGPTNIDIFYHDGGRYVNYDAFIEDLTLTDIDDTYTDVILSIPDFGDNAQAEIIVHGLTAAVGPYYVYCRKNGSAATANLILVMGGTNWISASHTAIVDASQTLELAFNKLSTSTIALLTKGFYLPGGM